jgi:hypothetical protein
MSSRDLRSQRVRARQTLEAPPSSCWCRAPGPRVGPYICNECVDLCKQIVAEELTRRTTSGDDPPTLKAWDNLSDQELLAEMVRAHAAHENVDRAVAHHVAELRARGTSWGRLGEALGMTRQSAWERFSGEE